MFAQLGRPGKAAQLYVPKSELEILGQEILEDKALYRIRARQRVHYLTCDIIFDEMTMCRPCLLIPELPPFPDTDWTRMRIRHSRTQTMEYEITNEPLSQVRDIWHHRHIDVLSLKRISSYNARVKEVEFEGRTAISKTAHLDEWIPSIEHETRVYRAIAELGSHDVSHLAPVFLGHLTEQGRPVGFLLEKIEGRAASLSELPMCKLALSRLHDMGILHGDVHRHNFIIERTTGRVRVIDFEHAEPLQDDEKARLEMEEMQNSLTEENIIERARGTSVLMVDGVESEPCTKPIPYLKFSGKATVA
ncbi:hypothetical protein HIM_09736 [Hirsutella minnesotensis 3608]|uniref:Protein kinase domain-containing protein n=1 Tax=Hirsutella minnesotensis 3608 TaxID=1043627 RepID=A0A0F7ZGG9_9HYPO|nr:hypothetical protein HIM_09736 [Hirsutella minnesotensis 3608]